MMKKKILYTDMNRVIADFEKSVLSYCNDLNTAEQYQDIKKRDAKIDHTCETNIEFFHNLLPYYGAIDAVHRLFELYEVYFLSTPMWDVPQSFTGKRIWIEKHFGKLGKKKIDTDPSKRSEYWRFPCR